MWPNVNPRKLQGIPHSSVPCACLSPTHNKAEHLQRNSLSFPTLELGRHQCAQPIFWNPVTTHTTSSVDGIAGFRMSDADRPKDRVPSSDQAQRGKATPSNTEQDRPGLEAWLPGSKLSTFLHATLPPKGPITSLASLL